MVFVKHLAVAIGIPHKNLNSKLWISCINYQCLKVTKTIILLIKFTLLKNYRELDLGIHITKKIKMFDHRIVFRVTNIWHNDLKKTNATTWAALLTK
jgi:hypothetical protein